MVVQDFTAKTKELIDNLKIEEGRKDLREGRTLSNDEVKQRMARWLSE